MKFLFVLMSLVLTSSLVFAANRKSSRKSGKRNQKVTSAYAANANVYSMSEIIHHIAVSSDKIAVISQGENRNFVLTDFTLAKALSEHRENKDKVRFDKFSCKTTEVTGILNCRLMVVENLKKGEMGLTAYHFKVAKDSKNNVRLLAPLQPVVVDGNEAPESSTVMQTLEPQRDAELFREFAI